MSQNYLESCEWIEGISAFFFELVMIGVKLSDPSSWGLFLTDCGTDWCKIVRSFENEVPLFVKKFWKNSTRGFQPTFSTFFCDDLVSAWRIVFARKNGQSTYGTSHSLRKSPTAEERFVSPGPLCLRCKIIWRGYSSSRIGLGRGTDF